MHRRAFTLIELLLAIALLAILAAFLYPNLKPEMQRRSLVESADRLRSLIVMCRAKAMQDGKKYRISFPGTPDPLDPHADDRVDVPFETLQPNIERQMDALGNPDWFGGFDEGWKNINVMQDGCRCVAVRPGMPNFELSADTPIAGPSISEGWAEFVPLTFNPDGSCDWVTFTLTDLPPETTVQPGDIGHIINVMVDGRTGQVWLQRALLNEEVELMQEEGASPILHIDFTRPDQITEENILHINIRQGGGTSGGRTGS